MENGKVRVQVAFTGGKCLEESVTYQAIMEEGVIKGQLLLARRMLILFGRQVFRKAPGRRARAIIEAIDSLERLEQLITQARHFRSWEELLAEVPAPEPARGRKKRG